MLMLLGNGSRDDKGTPCNSLTCPPTGRGLMFRTPGGLMKSPLSVARRGMIVQDNRRGPSQPSRTGPCSQDPPGLAT
ncbi:hypothetical protein J6590_032212 [Homalodisca vitripennis]|nr:hypothetical protein J6590_032212 [Homalodisca vitripennis]